MIAEDGLCFTAVRGPLSLEDALFVAQKSNRIAPLQLARADRVLGPEHVRHAARLAARAKAEGRAHAERAEVEFLRYLAGERNIDKALAKLGLPERLGKDRGALVVGLGPKAQDAVRHFVDALGLREDETLLAPSESKLVDFGITALQLEATTPARRGDLVLEAVASVDLR